MNRVDLMNDTPHDIDMMFAEFRSAYPKRRGSNPSMPALKSFVKACKRVDPRTIIDAARVYAAEQRSLGKENTEYVAQMSTWLNQERWRDYQRNGSPTKAMTWITMDDPRWRRMAGMYYAEKGTLPPHVAGVGGQGWRFPTAWITEEFGGGRFTHRSAPAMPHQQINDKTDTENVSFCQGALFDG